MKCEPEIAESIGVGGIKRDGLVELGGRILEPVEMEQEDAVRAITPGLVGPLLEHAPRQVFSFLELVSALWRNCPRKQGICIIFGCAHAFCLRPLAYIRKRAS